MGLVVRATLVACALLGSATVAVLLVADDDAVDAEVISHSVDVARSAGTAKSIFSFTLDAPPGFEQQAVSFGGEGQFDFRAERSRAVFRFSGALGGDGATPDTPSELEMEIVVDAGTVYLRMPALRSSVPEAPSDWFTLDFERLASITGRRSLGLGATDPTQTFEYLRGASTEIEEVGDETVGNLQTTHYRATVDLDRAVELAPEAKRELLHEAVRQFDEQFGTKTFPMDVWIDADGLPRRLRFEFDIGAFDTTGRVPDGAIMSFTMELSDYGGAVEIAPPPAEVVTDLTTRVGELESTTTGGAPG